MNQNFMRCVLGEFTHLLLLGFPVSLERIRRFHEVKIIITEYTKSNNNKKKARKMELNVGGNEVRLSLAPEYRVSSADGNSADAATNLLGAVQRYKPFVDYLTSFKAPAECELTTIVIKNVGQIGQRIASITLDVTLRHAKTNSSITQPLHLESDRAPSVILPVIEVAAEADGSSAGGQFAVLIPRARLALGAKVSLDAPMGYFESAAAADQPGAKSNAGKPIQLTNVKQEFLDQAGFTAKHLTEGMCKPLSTNDIVTGYEGQAPVQLLVARRSCSMKELSDLMQPFQQQGGSEAPFVLVPLEDVPNRTTDIHAILAASLFR